MSVEYEVSLLSPKPNDLIVIKTDKNNTGVNKLSSLIKSLKEKFPNNTFLLLDKNVDISTMDVQELINKLP